MCHFWANPAYFIYPPIALCKYYLIRPNISVKYESDFKKMSKAIHPLWSEMYKVTHPIRHDVTAG